MRACGGISKARSSSRPRRVPAPSGGSSLSMQNQPRGHGRSPPFGDLVEGNFQLIQRLDTAFVDPRMLAGWTDEQAGEQIGKRWMVLPVIDHAAQQVGTAKKRAVISSRSANHQ